MMVLVAEGLVATGFQSSMKSTDMSTRAQQQWLPPAKAQHQRIYPDLFANLGLKVLWANEGNNLLPTETNMKSSSSKGGRGVSHRE
jgi:hypothetical protein